jgi:hypothetical protein
LKDSTGKLKILGEQVGVKLDILELLGEILVEFAIMHSSHLKIEDIFLFMSIINDIIAI